MVSSGSKKYTKWFGDWGSNSDPTGELTALLLDFLAGFRGEGIKEREKGKERKERKRRDGSGERRRIGSKDTTKFRHKPTTTDGTHTRVLMG